MFPEDVNRGWMRELDNRASAITDPIERLRFLRTGAAKGECRRRGRRAASQAGAVILLTAMLGLASFHSVSPPVEALLQPGAVWLPPWSPLPPPPPPPSPLDPLPAVWQVETGPGYETYSNGLRIDTSREQPGPPRSFRPIAVATGERGPVSATPAGIVFHSSESELAPFAPETTDQIKRRRAGLLDYASRQRAYHYVIDRFGTVHRLVAESSKANHAGNSAWADESAVYVQLNGSFLGVAFESETNPGGGIERLTEAQVRGGRALVEMLRSRYRIPACNCITHAQVSVNPANGRVGYHTDWASGFPFAELGLPDNYSLPLPSILWFGFDSDRSYWEGASAGLRRGITAARRQLAARGLAQGIPVEALRFRLQQNYRAYAGTGDLESGGDEKSE